MKKILIAILLSAINSPVSAQILQERRVYYLDCSYSMVKPNDIWSDVCGNLINAIDKVSDETTELVVIPFAKDHAGSLNVLTAKANAKGKAQLKKQIQAIVPSKSSMTFLGNAWNDFVKNRVNHAKVTYLFFMTDGQNEELPDNMPKLLSEWESLYKGQHVYGFYVMLHDSAKNPTYSQIIQKQAQLWEVNTANVDINLIRVGTKAVFNVKNEEYFDLPVYGKVNDIKFSAQFSENVPYKVSKVIKENGKLRIFVSKPENCHQTIEADLNLQASGLEEYDFLVTENIRVSCEYKPECSLKISVK